MDRYLVLTASLAVALGGAGCGGDDDGGGDPGPGPINPDGGTGPVAEACDSGESYFFVLNTIDVGQPDATNPTVVPGFNLDDRVSDADDALGCNKPDATSPPPANAEGVDNALGSIASDLSTLFNTGELIAEALANGDVLVLMELANVDDLTNDGCVTTSLFVGDLPAGTAAPMLDAEGRIASGQTFDINPASLTPSGEPMVSVEGRIEQGSLSAGPVQLNLEIPVDASSLTLNIQDAQLSLQTGDGNNLTGGVLGGGLDIEETIATITGAFDSIDEAVVRPVLENAADLNPDVAGACQALSVGLVFEATTAVRSGS